MESTSEPVARHVAVIAGGTTGRNVAARLLARQRQNGQVDGVLPPEKYLVTMDSQVVGRPPLLEGPDPDAEPVTIPGECSVLMSLPDRQVLLESHGRGDLWFLPKHVLTASSVAREGFGTGGNQRTGRCLHVFQKRPLAKRLTDMLRSFEDYETQRMDLTMNGRQTPHRRAALAAACLSSCGGHGSGSFFDCVDTVREVGDRLGIEVTFVPFVIVMGTIEPVDVALATHNQESFLHYLQVRLSGGFCDFTEKKTDLASQIPFNSVILVSNQNSEGELADLSRLEGLVAEFQYYYLFTGLGDFLRSKVIDLEERINLDRWGSPQCVSAAGLSVVGLDRHRLRSYMCIALAVPILEAMLRQPALEQVARDAYTWAISMGIVETQDQHSALDQVTKLRAEGGAYATDRALAMLKERSQAPSQFQACIATDDAIDYVIGSYVGDRLFSAVKHKVSEMTDEFERRVRATVTRKLHAPQGIGEAEAWLSAQSAVLASSERSNANKLRRANDEALVAAAAIARLRSDLEGLRGLGCARILRPFFTRELLADYTLCAERLVRSKVETTARESLADYFSRSTEILRHYMRSVTKQREGVTAARAFCLKEMQRLESMPGASFVSLGTAILDAHALQAEVQFFTDQRGGQQTVQQELDHALFAIPQLFDLKIEHPAEPIRKCLLAVCRQYSAPYVDNVALADLLQRYAQRSVPEKDHITQLVRESRVRLPIDAEVSNKSRYIKLVGAETARIAQEWARRAKAVDDRPGPWLAAPTGDPDRVVFIQYCAGVAVRHFVANKEPVDPDELRHMAKAGIDPVVSLIPAAQPSTTQLSRVFAKGLITGQIQLDDKTGYLLRRQSGERVPLGDGQQQVIHRLRRQYSDVVEISCAFADQLRRRPREIMATIDSLPELAAVDHGLSLIDAHTAMWVRAEAEALMPYLSQIQPNSQPCHGRQQAELPSSHTADLTSAGHALPCQPN